MRYWMKVVAVLAVLFCANILHGVSGPSNASSALPVALQSEEGAWTHAPDVPPPIKRTEPSVVVVHWEVKETKMEITPGMVYDTYWTIEGTVPGPLLRVREGDTVEIHLKNSPGNSHPHNIDFHFVAGPGGGAGPLTVMPGQEAVLRVKATAPGFYMYHCAAAESIPTHIANGMYGFVLVDPAHGLPQVDHEWYVVQSEFYADQRTAGHLTFSFQKGLSERPDYVFWNGRFGALMGENALHANTGERIRLYIGNAGPNLVSSFHVIGTMFDAVYREGDLISPPAHGVQTTLIPSGGSAVVEFTPHVPGAYLLVDHSIFRIMKGAVGQIMVEGSAADGTQAREFYDPILTQHAAMGGHDMKGGAPAPPPLEEPEHAASVSLNNSNSGTGTGTVTIPYNASIQNAEKNHYYNPGFITVPKGTTVTWVNKDMMGHEMVFDTVDLGSGAFYPGGKWSHKFAAAGKYSYHCKPHPWMKGIVIVSDSAAPMVADTTDSGPQTSASEDSGPAKPPAPASATLRLLPHHAATPKLITVRQGGTVTLVNSDTMKHEVMFDSWSWDFRFVDPGVILQPGEKWTHTFTTAGTFDYHCRRHPWVKGTLEIR